MLAPQIVEAEAGRLYLPRGALDVPQVDRAELDCVIRRRLEVGHLPRARMPDRRGKDRGRRRLAVLHRAHL